MGNLEEHQPLFSTTPPANQETRPPCVIIMAGGTGGHIMPGLAVAEKMRHSGWKVYWLGNPDSMEGHLVYSSGFDLLPVHFAGLRGKGIHRALNLPFSLYTAMGEAWTAFKYAKPQVALGMGGYISVPGGLVAWLRRVPLIIHEQNSVAGLANRLLSIFAKSILCGFPNTMRRGQCVGIPIRAALTKLPRPLQRYSERSGPLRLLVIGGSLGAQAFNSIVPQAMASLPETSRPKIVHQSGKANIATLIKNYSEAGIQAKCVPFIKDMKKAYNWADLIICRAGASTIAELCAVGIPGVLVPLPHAVDDHQTSNAYFLANVGAAFLLKQNKIKIEQLAKLALLPRLQLQQMGELALGMAMPEAARSVADICINSTSIKPRK